MQSKTSSPQAAQGARLLAFSLILTASLSLTSCTTGHQSGPEASSGGSPGAQAASSPQGAAAYSARSTANSAGAVANSAGAAANSAQAAGSASAPALKAPASSQKLKNGDPDNRVTVFEVEAIAAEVDKGYADGWIDGRDPRVFKSPYKELTPMEKAKFAMAYHDMIEKSDQNLAQSYKTYIPYKKRAQFARQYWESSDLGPRFKKAIEKMQVAWIHESLLDGSELWWHAAEKRFGNAIDSPTQMAHDVEQNMVSKYMEDEATESTFSQQMSVKTHAR